MYFISSAYQNIYPDNKRSLFKNLLETPISGDNLCIKIDSVHLQKKIDVVDNEIIFISYTDPSNDTLENHRAKGLIGKFALFEYSISHHVRSCVVCIKFLPTYYPIKEFARTFNLFAKEYLENRVLLTTAHDSDARLALIVKSKCDVIASFSYLKILGFAPSTFVTYTKKIEDHVKFKNHAYMLDPKKKYYFKLIRSGVKYARNSYNKSFYTPQIIKIYCDQVSYSIESSKAKKLVAVLPGFEDNNCQKYDYYPTNPIKIKLNGSYLNSFKFKIADEQGKQLKFSTGFATYINASLVTTENTSKMNEEILTMISSDQLSKKIYTNNENNCFTIHLPKTLFKGPYRKWFMSVLNISLPSISPNIYSGENTITVTEIDDVIEEDANNVDTTEKNKKRKKNQNPNPYTVTIVPANYKTIDSLLAQFSRPIQKKTKVVVGVESVGLVSFVNESQRLKKISMHPNLALTLGLINQLPPEKMDVLDLTLKPTESYIASYEPDLKITENLYCKLLCNELVQSYFGDKNEEILKFIPLRNSSQQKSFFQEFHQKTKVEINSSSLSSLSFKLTRENANELIQFENKEVPTHMTLLIEREN